MKTKEEIRQKLEASIYYGLDGCWYWTGYANNQGYGRMSIDGKATLSTRASYEVYKGSVGSLLVCHTCDNPLCINPDHLFLGTHKDNAQDMVYKGRSNRCKGEDNGQSKLSNEDVLKIFAMQGLSSGQIAKQFNISSGVVRRIKQRKMWRHVTNNL